MSKNYQLFDKGGSSFGTGTSFKSCRHDGTAVVWKSKTDGVSFAGTRITSFDGFDADLLIDFSGSITAEKLSPERTIQGPEWLVSKLCRHIHRPEVLRVEWPDMTAPHHLSPTFWVALRRALKPNKHVVCACIGSHGRTGTGLACLMMAEDHIAGKQADPVAAVTWIRTHHCIEAIETAEQERYVVRAAIAFNDKLTKTTTTDERKRELYDAVAKLAGGSKAKSWSTGKAHGGGGSTYTSAGGTVVSKTGVDTRKVLGGEQVTGTALDVVKAAQASMAEDDAKRATVVRPSSAKVAAAEDADLEDMEFADDATDDDMVCVICDDPDRLPRRRMTGTADLGDPVIGSVYIDDANYEWLFLPLGDDEGAWYESDEIEFLTFEEAAALQLENELIDLTSYQEPNDDNNNDDTKDMLLPGGMA